MLHFSRKLRKTKQKMFTFVFARLVTLISTRSAASERLSHFACVIRVISVRFVLSSSARVLSRRYYHCYYCYYTVRTTVTILLWTCVYPHAYTTEQDVVLTVRNDNNTFFFWVFKISDFLLLLSLSLYRGTFIYFF